MLVLITGSRWYLSKGTIYFHLRKLKRAYGGELKVIHGAAPGADTLAEEVCRQLEIDFTPFPANWGKYGSPAGPIRNNEMLSQNPDVVLAFHEDISKSRGTKDCIFKANLRKIPVRLYP